MINWNLNYEMQMVKNLRTSNSTVPAVRLSPISLSLSKDLPRSRITVGLAVVNPWPQQQANRTGPFWLIHVSLIRLFELTLDSALSPQSFTLYLQLGPQPRPVSYKAPLPAFWGTFSHCRYYPRPYITISIPFIALQFTALVKHPCRRHRPVNHQAFIFQYGLGFQLFSIDIRPDRWKPLSSFNMPRIQR